MVTCWKPTTKVAEERVRGLEGVALEEGSLDEVTVRDCGPLGALLLGACPTGRNTPLQDLVWSTYKQCKAEGRVPSSIQLDRVEPDGRAWYSASRSTYGTQELESCMTEKTRTSKTPIPPAYPPVISR